MGTDIYVNVAVPNAPGAPWSLVKPGALMMDRWPIAMRNKRMFGMLLGRTPSTMPAPRGWQGLLDQGVFPAGFDIYDDLNYVEAPEIAAWCVCLYGQHWLDESDFATFGASGGYSAPIRRMHQAIRALPGARVIFSFDQPV